MFRCETEADTLISSINHVRMYSKIYISTIKKVQNQLACESFTDNLLATALFTCQMINVNLSKPIHSGCGTWRSSVFITQDELIRDFNWLSSNLMIMSYPETGSEVFGISWKLKITDCSAKTPKLLWNLIGSLTHRPLQETHATSFGSPSVS